MGRPSAQRWRPQPPKRAPREPAPAPLDLYTLRVSPDAPARVAPALPPWPYYAPDEVAAVVEVLESGRVNQWTGDDVARFEAAYAEALEVPHCIALANGTLALEAALAAFDIGPGADVLVPARSFAASATCVLARGGRPRFVDLADDSQLVSVETLEAARTPETRAAIIVHLGGAMPDMIAICAWAESKGIVLIEDCAQAHGASWAGRPAGAWGDAAAFSFCQDKIITTGGEGGLLTTHDDAAFRRAWSVKDHGKSYARVFEATHPPGFRWLIESAGSNWRMTGMQAAIGLRQLAKLPEWNAKRTAHAATLERTLASVEGLRFESRPEALHHAWYRAYAYLDGEAMPWVLRDRILELLAAGGWPAQSGVCPEIYRERVFAEAGFAPTQPFARAAALGSSSLAFSVHPNCSDAQIEAYGQAIVAACGRAREELKR